MIEKAARKISIISPEKTGCAETVLTDRANPVEKLRASKCSFRLINLHKEQNELKHYFALSKNGKNCDGRVSADAGAESTKS